MKVAWKIYQNLNEFARKLSICVPLWNAEVKSLPLVERHFQIWKLEFFTVLGCKGMYSCHFSIVRIPAWLQNQLNFQLSNYQKQNTFTSVTKGSARHVKQSINSCLDSKTLYCTCNKRDPCMKYIFINHIINSEQTHKAIQGSHVLKNHTRHSCFIE